VNQTTPILGSSAAAPDDADVAWVRLPATFRLACACCRWPPSPQRDALVRQAAVGVDWDAFQRVVVRQRVHGLAWAALRAAGVTMPAAVESELAAAAQLAARRGMALAAESMRLQALFTAAGIPSLVIKGATVAQLAYATQALKQGRDIDLLVRPADAERGLALLEREGYVTVNPPGPLTPAKLQLVFRHHKDIEFGHAERRVSVELHWRLIDNHRLLKRFGPGSPTQVVKIAGAPLVTLADRELFAYLCVHGASHSWFRLKWLADLNAWLASKREDELTSFYKFAVDEGVGDCAAQALILCRQLLGLTLPPALAASFKGLKLRVLVSGALDAMAGGRAELELQRRPLGPFRLMPAQFLRGRGLRFFLAQCWLVTQSLDDMLMFPLPRPLHFLYPLLRLPLWLVRISRRHAARAAPSGAVPAAGPGRT
jgi:hypothetical protein